MTKPTEKVYLKKFYIAITMVVRARRFFKKNLGMGEWAPPFFVPSSATPLPPLPWHGLDMLLTSESLSY